MTQYSWTLYRVNIKVQKVFAMYTIHSASWNKKSDLKRKFWYFLWTLWTKTKTTGRPNKNNQSLTLLDNGLSLSTSFVLSMSIWAAVATPKTSWDVDVLGSFCKLRQISWPESTVDQQQDQQREECGSHSPGDKHLRLAPSPSCIWWTTRIETWSSMIYTDTGGSFFKR